MKPPLLILDCNYLCRRAHHSTGQLSFGGNATGAVYGFLRDLIALQETHDTDRVVFCFDGDSRISKRKEIFPGYKASRNKGISEEERTVLSAYYQQVDNLRLKYLPALGYRNILMAEGYEADDVIARIAEMVPSDDFAYIVSTDQDFWQLLSPYVAVWNPAKSKSYTHIRFRMEWGLRPSSWVNVKSIAGCSSDCIPGVPGVGEKTAAKYLRAELPENGATRKKIIDAVEQTARNRKLIQLPLEGCPTFELRPDEVTPERWRIVLKKLGFATLARNFPITRGIDHGE